MLGGAGTLLPASGSPACASGDVACSSHACHVTFTKTLGSTPKKEPQMSLRRWREEASRRVSVPLRSGPRGLPGVNL